MIAISFILQLLVAVALSGGVFYLLGSTIYMGMATLVFLIAFAVVYAHDKTPRDDGSLSRAARDFLETLGLVTYAAVFWPSLPLIFARGRHRDETPRGAS